MLVKVPGSNRVQRQRWRQELTNIWIVRVAVLDPLGTLVGVISTVQYRFPNHMS